MPKYYIEIPYTGKLMIEIEANSEEEALEKIYETDPKELDKLDCVDFVEMEEAYHTKVIQGHVYYGVLDKMSVKVIEDRR